MHRVIPRIRRPVSLFSLSVHSLPPLPSPLSPCVCSQFPSSPTYSKQTPTSIRNPFHRQFTATTIAYSQGNAPFEERLRLKLFKKGTPPPDRPQLPSEAVRPSRIEELKNYVPDVDARGLRIVGMEGEEKDYTVHSFAPLTKATSPADIHRAVRKAVVEVYANILNKQPGDRACTYPTTVSKEGEVTEEVGISMKDREFQFDFKSAETLKHILNPVMEVEAEGVEGETVKVVEEVPVSVQDGTPQPEEPIPEFKGGNDWTELLFPSDDVKFAILKRSIQLTGHHPSDNAITQMKTVSHLLTELIAPPPPTKLAEVLLSDDFPLSSLPNVKIFPERLRPLDKERMIGRLSPGQEEILYEKAKIARGEVPEMEMESYRYPFEKSDYA